MATVRDLSQALSRWTPGAAPAVSWLLPELRDLLRAQFAGAYRPAATDAGWALEFMHGAGEAAAKYVRLFHGYVASLPRSETFLALSNPHLVDVEQRNRVMSLRQIIRVKQLGAAAEPFDSLFRTLGIAGHDQLRVMICQGPRQLAWMGATREESFTRRESVLLQRLTAPLQQRLTLEQRLGPPGLVSAALEAALEAVRAPAYVVGPDFEVELGNRVGMTVFQREQVNIIDGIRASACSDGASGPFSITRIVSPGWPPYLLAVHKQPDPVIWRVSRARELWGLSTRQARVLELLATGASNKEIAAALGCAEATIENHVTELFRRSGTTSRAGLVGRLIGLE